MTKNLKRALFATAIVITVAGMFASCKSVDHSKDFAMQAEIRDDYGETKQIFISGTKSVDSADAAKIVFDVYRVESDKYPDSLKCFARVYDSLGFFITDMADPYLKTKSTRYFTKIREVMGGYLKRHGKVDEFKVREYGAGDSIPYNIVLSTDYSGSMTAVLNAIFEGTEMFVRMKTPYDQIAILAFNKDVRVLSELSKDTAKILRDYRNARKSIDGYFSAVNDAVGQAIDIFAKTDSTVPRVFVVFTDGDDNNSKLELAELIDKAKAMNIHIFAVAFGYSDDVKMRMMAKHTGGKFYKVYSKEDLVKVFKDIYMSLRNYYLITYTPPKFIGLHDIFASLNLPKAKDTIFGRGDYNTSGIDLLGDGDVFTRPIKFDFDKYEIKPESESIIDEIADAMYINPKYKLEIQGHTDYVGTAEYNQVLSERRAEAVMFALIKKGVDEKRLRSRGFGATMPVAANDSEENRAKNRRTQFLILAK